MTTIMMIMIEFFGVRDLEELRELLDMERAELNELLSPEEEEKCIAAAEEYDRERSLRG